MDSSVAAHLLQKSGHHVFGIFMLTPADTSVEDARRICRKLGIPLHIVDCRKEFNRKVISYFSGEYKRGRTPNPCIVCNEKLKFGILLDEAVELGASHIATGHYANVEYNKAGGRYVLKTGADPKKDQSYMLFSLSQNQLSRSLFPLGGYLKRDVYKIAGGLGLTPFKSESQDICFAKDKEDDLTTHSGKPYKIIDVNGNLLGNLSDRALLTIGQRKRLGINPGSPLYVIKIDADANAITVGSEEELLQKEMVLCRLNWIAIPSLGATLACKAKIRYSHRQASCIVTPLGNKRVRVKFARAQRAITPGQAAVFYDKDIVIGGGWIC